MDKVLRALGHLILRVKKFEKVAGKIHEDLKWLFTKELYEYRIICTMYRICSNDNVEFFSNYLIRSNAVHQYNTRRNEMYAVTYKPKLEVGKCVFQYQAVKLWNNLPEQIRIIKSYHMFKKDLCKFMIKPK